MFEKVEKSNMIFESFCRMIESFSNNDVSVFWWQEQRTVESAWKHFSLLHWTKNSSKTSGKSKLVNFLQLTDQHSLDSIVICNIISTVADIKVLLLLWVK